MVVSNSVKWHLEDYYPMQNLLFYPLVIATNVKKLPGEAMHLAGALQYAGFSSVIATMWGVTDTDTAIVASHVYQYLFRNGSQGCDSSEATMALNRTIFLLRDRDGVTMDRWGPFIHFGI